MYKFPTASSANEAGPLIEPVLGVNNAVDIRDVHGCDRVHIAICDR